MPRKEETDERGYPCAPRMVGKKAWFYEERAGLYVATERVGAGRVHCVVIPWAKIEAAVDRHRAIKRKLKK